MSDEKKVIETTEEENSALLPFEATNEIEKLLVQLHSQEVTSEDFLGAIFNGPLFVLTTEENVDKENKKLVDNPKLFTLFGGEKQPFLALFTDRNRVRPVQEKDSNFSVVIQVKAGDLLAGAVGAGIVINPFWENHARWEPKQIAAFKNIMQRSEEGLWSKLPKEQLMTVNTADGGPIQIPREQFRQQILPQHIKELNDKPEELYGLIMNAVNDGFHVEILDAAHHLHEIDTIKERSTTALSIALLSNKKLDEAETLLNEYLAKEKSPVILANLAKLYEAREDKDKSLSTLEEALTLNPNMASALEWYCSILDKNGGKEAVVSALDELDGIAKSWMPALLLGRVKVNDDKPSEAVEHYTDAMEVVEHAPDTLIRATSELGQKGFHKEIIELTNETYDIQRDDPRGAFNALQACRKIEDRDSGLALCEKMSAIPLEDVTKVISQFKEEFDKM